MSGRGGGFGRLGTATGSTGAAAPRRSGGGGGGWRGFGGGAGPVEKLPKERRDKTLRRMLGFFAPYKAKIAVVLVAILATSFIGLINPLLLKQLIDVAIPEKNWQLLPLFVGLMIILPIISGLIGVGQSYLNNVVGQNVMHDLRTALYTHLQAMPLRFFTETKTGEIQSRLANDVGGIQSVVTDTRVESPAERPITVSTIIVDVPHRLAADAAVAGAAAVLHVPDVPRREGQSRDRGRDPGVARGDDRGHRGDPVGVGMLLTKTFGQQQAAIGRFERAQPRARRGSRSARRWSVAGSS